MSLLLSRSEAETVVREHVIEVAQYRAVPIAVCAELLGDRVELLLADPIRSVGPSPDAVYPWNLVDYLCVEDPCKSRRRHQGAGR